jgi:hypothetical protein
MPTGALYHYSRAQLSQFGQSAATVWPRRGCALRLRCVETTRGKTMPKLLNELERKPCPLALAERDSREALRDRQSLTAAFFGDPLPGLSALDRREQRESLTRAPLVV